MGAILGSRICVEGIFQICHVKTFFICWKDGKVTFNKMANIGENGIKYTISNTNFFKTLGGLKKLSKIKHILRFSP